jgi:quinol monooxygenase YgiN
MADEAITVLARLKAKTGMEEKVKSECLALVEPTRAEEGCINYDFHQGADEPAQFMFYENWTSKAALDEHIATPHLQRFIGMADELLEGGLDVTIYKKLA